jgi:hypothetical protein
MAHQPEATHPNYAQPPLLTPAQRETVFLPAPTTRCDCRCEVPEQATPTVIEPPSVGWLVLAAICIAAIVVMVWRACPREIA